MFFGFIQWKCRPSSREIRLAEDHPAEGDFSQDGHSGKASIDFSVSPTCGVRPIENAFPFAADLDKGVQLWQPPQAGLHRGRHPKHLPHCEARQPQSLRCLPFLPERTGQSSARYSWFKMHICADINYTMYSFGSTQLFSLSRLP